MAVSPKTRSFDAPQEPDWHRSIAEAAYYLAEKREFSSENALEDWLAAEQQMRQVISPTLDSEVTMNGTTRPNRTQSEAKAPPATQKPAESDRAGPSSQSNRGQSTPPDQGVSRFEKFAATQAAGDGVQGDTLKKDKTVDEKLGAKMADRK
jgi:hypothetical protein